MEGGSKALREKKTSWKAARKALREKKTSW